MANEIDGGTAAQGVVSGLDQEELTLREKLAKQKGPKRADGGYGASEPGKTPIGTGETDDAYGAAAGGPTAP